MTDKTSLPGAADVIALAEKCSAEVGRYEGKVVWVKFHSQAAIEAFATGVVMSAAVRSHAKPVAPKAEQAATQAGAPMSMEAWVRLTTLEQHNLLSRGYPHPGLAAPTAPTGAQAEPSERLKLARIQAHFGLTEAQARSIVEGAHGPSAEQAAPKAEPILREVTDALRERIDFKSDIKVADLIRRAEKLMDGQGAPAIYHEGVNIERLQQACRAFGLRADESMEAFVSGSVFADHCNRLTSAVLKHVLTRPAHPQGAVK
jgi:hypothetical protein